MATGTEKTDNSTIVKYKYIAEMQYLEDGVDPINIDRINIKTIIIKYDYINFNMPTVIATLVVDNSLIYKLRTHQNSALINFTLYKVNDSGDDLKIREEYIKDQFVYFTNATTKESDVYEAGEEQGMTFNEVVLCMLSSKLVENNTKSFSGALDSSVDLFSLVNFIIDNGSEKIIEPLENNSKLPNNSIIPSLDSKGQIIKYINENIKAFYKTSYRYFADFNAVYLVGSSGKGTMDQAESINDIIIYLKVFSNPLSFTEGITIDDDNKVYKVYCNEQTCDAIKDESAYRKISSILAVNVDGSQTIIPIGDNTKPKKSDKRLTIKIKNGNTAIVQNIQSDIENSVFNLAIMKEDLDASIFTINKRILVESSSTFGEEFTGAYNLRSKVEYYEQQMDDLKLVLMLNLNKVAAAKIPTALASK